MPATPDDLFTFLDAHGIETQTHTHPPLFTVEDSRALRGEIPGAHTKNLFLKDRDGRLFLLVAEEDTRVDLKTLHLQLGARGRLSFGSPALLEDVWGVTPGSVTPFGALNDRAGRVTVVLDRHLAAQPLINAHPLINTMTTAIARDDLMRFLQLTGHDPILLDPGGPSSSLAVAISSKLPHL